MSAMSSPQKRCCNLLNNESRIGTCLGSFVSRVLQAKQGRDELPCFGDQSTRSLFQAIVGLTHWPASKLLQHKLQPKLQARNEKLAWSVWKSTGHRLANNKHDGGDSKAV